jgi:hypothetical protein
MMIKYRGCGQSPMRNTTDIAHHLTYIVSTRSFLWDFQNNQIIPIHNLLQIISDLGANPPDTIQEALKIIGDHFSISKSDIERLSPKNADTIATLIIHSNPSFLTRYHQHRKTKKPLTPSDKKIRSAVSTVSHYLSSLFAQQQSTEIINIQQAEHQRIREIEQSKKPHPPEHQETTLPPSCSPLPEGSSIISLEDGG